MNWMHFSKHHKQHLTHFIMKRQKRLLSCDGEKAGGVRTRYVRTAPRARRRAPVTNLHRLRLAVQVFERQSHSLDDRDDQGPERDGPKVEPA